MTPNAAEFEPRLDRRRRAGRVFAAGCVAFSLSAVFVLGLLLYRVFEQGLPVLSGEFLGRFPSNLTPERSGIRSAIAGTIWLIVLTTLVAVPVGIAAAVFLEEYLGKKRWVRLIQLNISNLAGVPSIVYGILGLALFVRELALGRTVLAGALTLGLLVLPVIILTSREALAAVPRTLREAAFALGATRWQTVWHHVLPAALPGILTGVILSISRAIGEAAPLIVIGAVTYVAFVPGGTVPPPDALGDWPGWLLTRSGAWTRDGLASEFTALPVQIYDWCDRPQELYRHLAAGAIIVLLGVLLTLNATAIAIRSWHQRKKAW